MTEKNRFAKRYIASSDGNCGKHFQRITDSCAGKPENGKFPEQCLTCKRFVP